MEKHRAASQPPILEGIHIYNPFCYTYATLQSCKACLALLACSDKSWRFELRTRASCLMSPGRHWGSAMFTYVYIYKYIVGSVIPTYYLHINILLRNTHVHVSQSYMGAQSKGDETYIYIYDIYVYTVDVCSFKKFQAPVLKHFLIYGNISDISHKLDLQQPGPTIAKKELYMQDEKIRIAWKYSWPSTNPPMDPKWTKQMHTYTYIYHSIHKYNYKGDQSTSQQLPPPTAVIHIYIYIR